MATNISLGFVGALQILFIALKLLDKINWTWFWVLSPTWISAIFGVIFLIIFFIWGRS